MYQGIKYNEARILKWQNKIDTLMRMWQ